MRVLFAKIVSVSLLSSVVKSRQKSNKDAKLNVALEPKKLLKFSLFC